MYNTYFLLAYSYRVSDKVILFLSSLVLSVNKSDEDFIRILKIKMNPSGRFLILIYKETEGYLTNFSGKMLVLLTS